MSTRARIAIGLVLLAFADLNAYVIWRYGYLGFLELVTANTATIAAVVDLTIALTLVAVWMWRDARRRGVSPLPYVALTARARQHRTAGLPRGAWPRGEARGVRMARAGCARPARRASAGARRASTACGRAAA